MIRPRSCCNSNGRLRRVQAGVVSHQRGLLVRRLADQKCGRRLLHGGSTLLQVFEALDLVGAEFTFNNVLSCLALYEGGQRVQVLPTDI